MLFRRPPSLLRAFLLGGTGILLAFACSVDEADPDPPTDCNNPSCTMVENDGSVAVGAVPEAGMEPVQAAVSPYAALCGVGSCDPASTDTCSQGDEDVMSFPEPATTTSEFDASIVPVPQETMDASIEEPLIADAGTDAGLLDDDLNDDDETDDAVSDMSGEGASSGSSTGAEMDRFDGGTPPSVAPSEFACRVVSREGGELARECRLAGTGQRLDPCTSSRDCGAGLTCVGGDNGQCLPFCCADVDACAAGSYCAPRPVKSEDANVQPRPLLPVCVPALRCSLAEASPCPAGAECACPSGQACTVVRRDGTTSCVVPGEGVAGEACPCAAGYLCAPATQTCQKICEIGSADACDGGKCAAGNLPEGWGVCLDD